MNVTQLSGAPESRCHLSANQESATLRWIRKQQSVAQPLFATQTDLCFCKSQQSDLTPRFNSFHMRQHGKQRSICATWDKCNWEQIVSCEMLIYFAVNNSCCCSVVLCNTDSRNQHYVTINMHVQLNKYLIET